MNSLSEFVFNLQEGKKPDDRNNHSDTCRIMEELVDKYGTFPKTDPDQSRRQGGLHLRGRETIVCSVESYRFVKLIDCFVQLLTGVTGFLASFLLHQLSALPTTEVTRIVCLVRAEDDEIALSRIKAVLRKRGLRSNLHKVDVHAADLSQPDLGLIPKVFARLLKEVSIVIHASPIVPTG